MSMYISNPSDALSLSIQRRNDMLSREVYANVRDIILKHIMRSFVFITTSGNSLTIYYCIASVTRTLFDRF